MLLRTIPSRHVDGRILIHVSPRGTSWWPLDRINYMALVQIGSILSSSGTGFTVILLDMSFLMLEELASDDSRRRMRRWLTKGVKIARLGVGKYEQANDTSLGPSPRHQHRAQGQIPGHDTRPSVLGMKAIILRLEVRGVHSTCAFERTRETITILASSPWKLSTVARRMA